MANETFTYGIQITSDSSGAIKDFKAGGESADKFVKSMSALDKKTSKTGRTFKRTSNSTSELSRKFKDGSIAAKLFKTSLAGFAVGAAAGVTLAVKNTVRYADELGKLSDRLGISTEALSQLNHAANLSGVQFSTLEQGLQRMIRRVAEAANGTGEAVKALDELGLSADKLKELTPDKQFEVLADALNGVENSADRVRLAMKLFDSEGVRLLQLMKGGSAGIRQMREEADKLGLTIDKSLADQAEKANDEFTRFTGQMRAFGNVLSIEVLPSVTQVAAAINRLFGVETRSRIEQINDKIGVFREQIAAHENNGAIGSMIDDFYGFDVNLVKNRIDILIKERNRLQSELNKPIASKGVDVSLEDGQTNTAKKGVAALNEITKARISGANTQKKLIDDVAKREQAALKQMDSAKIALLKASGSQAEALEKEITGRYATMLANLPEQSKVAGQQIVDELISKEKLELSLDQMKTQVDNALDAMGNRERSIDVSVNTGVLTELEGRKAVLELHKETAAALDEVVINMEAVARLSSDPRALNGVEKVKLKVRELATESTILETHVRDSLGSAFTDVFTGIGSDIKSAGDALKVFTLSVLDSIAQIAAQEAAQKSSSLIAGLLGTAVGALGGAFGGGASAATSSAGGIISSGGANAGISADISKFLQFHSGGDNLTGRSGKKVAVNPALFANAPRFHNGLQGDEFPAILQTGEDVVARDDPRNSRFGGGSTKTTVMNITSIVSVEGEGDDARKMQGISLMLDATIKKALVKEKRPGGLLSS